MDKLFKSRLHIGKICFYLGKQIGQGCSKLMMSLVDVLLKIGNMPIFFWFKQKIAVYLLSRLRSRSETYVLLFRCRRWARAMELGSCIHLEE